MGETYSCDPLEELGWLHVGERYYDPACGRFVQRDPIGIRGGWNVYVYVANMPTVGFDPFGLDYWIEGGPRLARYYLNLTGGAHSWLDNKNTVRNVSIVLGVVGGAVGGGTLCAGFYLAGSAAAATAPEIIPYGLFRLYQQREQLINYLNSHGPDTPFWAGFVEELGQINNLIDKYPR